MVPEAHVRRTREAHTSFRRISVAAKSAAAVPSVLVASPASGVRRSCAHEKGGKRRITLLHSQRREREIMHRNTQREETRALSDISHPLPREKRGTREFVLGGVQPQLLPQLSPRVLLTCTRSEKDCMVNTDWFVCLLCRVNRCLAYHSGDIPVKDSGRLIPLRAIQSISSSHLGQSHHTEEYETVQTFM
jgi:hypothetical protein